MPKIPILVIAGPTASGKSALAIEMAQCFNGEIVSADSMQIYRGLDIGTAKVTAEEQAQAVHHLIDLIPMTASFSVADFVKAADEAILAIHQKGKLPIVTGGTGFYVKALLGLQNLDFQASNPEEVALLEKKSLDELVQSLKAGPQSDFIATVDLNNKQRVIRALQIQKYGLKNSASRPEYQSLVLAPDWPRQALYDRINARVELMFDQGIEKEAQQLYQAGGLSLQAGKAIGYKEFYPYFEGQGDLASVKAAIQQDSRRYAKRQLTYWRHQIPGLEWLPADQIQTELPERVSNWQKALG